MNHKEILNQLDAEANDLFKELTIYGVNDNARKGLPFIIASDDALPEIPVAMNFSLSIMTVAGAMGTAGPEAATNIDRATEMGIENRLCNSVKMAAYYLEAGILPVPDMIITTNSPCDAVDMLGQLMDKYKPGLTFRNSGSIRRMAMNLPISPISVNNFARARERYPALPVGNLKWTDFLMSAMNLTNKQG